MQSRAPLILAPPPVGLEPQWRRNPITGDWVIIAPERATRPIHLSQEHVRDGTAAECPFCAGHEGYTPAELFAVRDADTRPNEPGWLVRVVPNRYPSVRDLGRYAPEPSDFFACSAGFGMHEVVIECPQHTAHLASLSAEQLGVVVTAWHSRFLALSGVPELQYAQLFKNQGAAGGASVEHAHSQIIGMPLIPPYLLRELAAGSAYFEQVGRCIFCDLLARELREEVRLVTHSDSFVVLTAFAGRQPYEMWVIPREHTSRFEQMPTHQRAELGRILSQALRALDMLIPELAYNIMLHTAPFHAGSRPDYHWHLEILPRLSQVAGLEWGSGVYVNWLPPEDAARELRGVLAR